MKSAGGKTTASITGVGAVHCLGTSPQELWDGALNERSGINDGLGHVSDAILAQMRERVVHSPFHDQFDLLFSRLLTSKALLMPFYALTQALESSGNDAFNSDDGLIIATTTGQITVWDKELIRYLNKEISGKEFEKAFRHQPLGSLLEMLVELTNFSGKTLLVTSACSAATQAIALGAQWIKQGRVKRCFVGGSEILCDLTVSGFRSLQLLSNQASAPFDIARSGINLSEGAGFICLEDESGSRAQACISGYGMSSDSYHMTAPHPEGQGSLRAMQEALISAELTPAEISWVHAHGTGSQHNDLAEAHAIKQLFGEKRPFVSSTKRIHGHALGASGALETILCVQALNAKTILRTSGLNKPDPQIDLNHPSRHLLSSDLPAPFNHILKNTLGFGGINASLVISRAPGAHT